jgi:hypothetical protein
MAPIFSAAMICVIAKTMAAAMRIPFLNVRNDVLGRNNATRL